MAEQTTFEYLNLIERHRRAGHGSSVIAGPPNMLRERERHLVKAVERDGGPRPALCWTGTCAGCGRNLISATWAEDAGGASHWRIVYCTRKCREAHGG